MFQEQQKKSQLDWSAISGRGDGHEQGPHNAGSCIPSQGYWVENKSDKKKFDKIWFVTLKDYSVCCCVEKEELEWRQGKQLGGYSGFSGKR